MPEEFPSARGGASPRCGSTMRETRSEAVASRFPLDAFLSLTAANAEFRLSSWQSAIGDAGH